MFEESIPNYLKITATVVLDLIFVMGICNILYFRRTVYSSTVPFTSIMITLTFMILITFMCYDFLHDKVVCFWYLWIYYMVFIIIAASYTVKCARMILQFHTNLVESKGDDRNSSFSLSCSSSSGSHFLSDASNTPSNNNLLFEEFIMSEYNTTGQKGEKQNGGTSIIGDRQQQFEMMIQGIDDDVTTQQKMLKKQKLALYMYSKRHWANTRNLVKIFLGVFCLFTTFPIIVNVSIPQYYETPWESACNEKPILDYLLLLVILLFIIAYFIGTLSAVRKQPRVMFLKRHLIAIVLGWLCTLVLGIASTLIYSIFQTATLQHALEIIVLFLSIPPFYGEVVDPFIYYMRIDRKKKKRKAIYDQIDGIEDVFDFDPQDIYTTTNTHSSNDMEDTEHGITPLKKLKKRKRQRKRDRMVERQRDILKYGVKYLRYFILDTRFIDEDIKHQYQMRLDFIAKVFEYGGFARYHQSMSSANLLSQANNKQDDNSGTVCNNTCFKIGYIYKLWRLFFQDYYVVVEHNPPIPLPSLPLSSSIMDYTAPQQQQQQQQQQQSIITTEAELKINMNLDLQGEENDIVVSEKESDIITTKSNSISEKENFISDIKNIPITSDISDNSDKRISITFDQPKRNHRRDMKRFREGKILETEKYSIQKNMTHLGGEENPIGNLKVNNICYLHSLSSCDANVINERDMLRISHQFLRLYNENVSFINEEIFEDWKRSPYFYLFIEQVIEHAR